MSGSETNELASTLNENSWAESELDSEVDADCGVVSIGAAAILTRAISRIMNQSLEKALRKEIRKMSI